MRYVRTVAPASPLVTLDDAKAHLRVDGSDEDELIGGVIASAIQHLDGRDGITGRALVTQTWRLDTCSPPSSRIYLDVPPVQAISQVQYRSGGQLVTWASNQWRLAFEGRRAKLVANDGVSWPGTDDREDAWQVTFVAGYGAPADVPAPIRSAALLLIGSWYQQREQHLAGSVSELPVGVDRLLTPYRAAFY
jgi:uncharacterized phiE125 gp8 family phage protein